MSQPEWAALANRLDMWAELIENDPLSSREELERASRLHAAAEGIRKSNLQSSERLDQKQRVEEQVDELDAIINIESAF